MAPVLVSTKKKDFQNFLFVFFSFFFFCLKIERKKSGAGGYPEAQKIFSISLPLLLLPRAQKNKSKKVEPKKHKKS